MNTLFELSTNHPDAALESREWLSTTWNEIRCQKCNGIGKSWHPRPIDVILAEHPGHKVCCFACNANFRIFHVDYIEQIRPYIFSYVIGNCLLPNGKIIKEYVTCYTDKRILIRGEKKTRYGKCQVCGGLSCIPIGAKYTLRSYLTDAKIYQDYFSTHYIDEDLAMDIDFSPWPDAELEPIEIHDEPLDGHYLPCDSPDAPWRKKFSNYF